MMRRAITLLLLVAVLAGCSRDGGTAPSVLPPTTRPPTPVEPTGMADAVRRWVRALEEGAGAEDAAFAALGPRTQEAIGGREGYRTARRELRQVWGIWAERAGVTYDALPVEDGLGVVLVSGQDEETGELLAEAIPVVVRGDDWAVEPLLDTGQFRVEPEADERIGVVPELRVEVDDDVRLTAYVGNQPAEVGDGAPASAGRTVLTYRPPVELRAGILLVTLVFQQGDDVTARVVRYEVVED